MREQALGRRLVLGEAPDAPEVRQERREAALRARRDAVRPALLGDLRRVALGHRPGARRIHDQRAACPRPATCCWRRRPRPAHRAAGTRASLLAVVERLPHGVGLDRDLAVRVDQLGAERLEERARRIDRVGGRCRGRCRTARRPCGRPPPP